MIQAITLFHLQLPFCLIQIQKHYARVGDFVSAYKVRELPLNFKKKRQFVSQKNVILRKKRLEGVVFLSAVLLDMIVDLLSDAEVENVEETGELDVSESALAHVGVEAHSLTDIVHNASFVVGACGDNCFQITCGGIGACHAV